MSTNPPASPLPGQEDNPSPVPVSPPLPNAAQIPGTLEAKPQNMVFMPGAPAKVVPPGATNAHNANNAQNAAWVTVGLWAVVAFLLGILNDFARQIFPFLPPEATPAGHVIASAYLAALLAALLFTARSAAHLPHRSGFLILVGALVAAPVGIGVLLSQLRIPVPPLLAVTSNNLLLPVGAALAGAGIGRVIKHPNTLLAAAGFAVFFDIVMVTMGTVAIVLQTNSRLIAAASVGGGVAGAATPDVPRPGFVPPPPPLSSVTIGPADVLFLGLFLSAIALLRLNERGTLVWMFGLLAGALVIVEVTGLPVPALAPMGVAVLLANARHGAFTQREKRDLAIGATFAVVLAGLLVAGARGVLGGGGGGKTTTQQQGTTNR